MIKPFELPGLGIFLRFRRCAVRALPIVLALLHAGNALGGTSDLSMQPSVYQLESMGFVEGGYNVVVRAAVRNTGPEATNVTAQLSSDQAGVTIIDGAVAFGTVATIPNSQVFSADTFKLRVVLPSSTATWWEANAYVTSVLQSLVWRIGCEGCGNRAPVALAGTDRTVAPLQDAMLDGSASGDADGDSLAFTWTIVSAPSGSQAQLSNAHAVRPRFAPDIEGRYLIQLVVSDGNAASAPSTLTLSTTNSPPRANAGPDQSAHVGDTIQLDGSGSSDTDGDPLIYEWSLVEVPESSAAQITDRDLTAPLAKLVVDKPGRYLALLSIRDPSGVGTPDTVVISTDNSAPTANAGPDQAVSVGQTVEIGAQASSDPDNDPLSFRWSLTKPAGSAAVLANDVGATTSLSIDVPGEYLVQLIVSDGQHASEPDTVLVSTLNSGPTAVAEPGIATALVGQRVHLDGSLSSDPDGDGLSFVWSLIALPLESGALLQDANTPRASFVPDHPGTYVVQLIVSDGQADSEPSTSRVTVSVDSGQPPQITIASPADGEYVRSASVMLQGRLDRVAALNINGAPAVLDDVANFSHALELSEGANEITLVAQDEQGSSTLIWHINVDREPPLNPVAALISIRAGQAGQIIVSGSAGAVEAYARVHIFTEDGGEAAVIADASGAFSVAIEGRTDAVLHVRQDDRAGNWSSVVSTSIADRLDFTIDWPSDGKGIAEPIVTLRGVLRGSIDAALVANGVPAAIVGNDHERQYRVSVPLTDGLNTVSVMATTLDGMQVQRSIQLTRIESQPFAIVASVAEGAAPLKVSFELERFDPTVIRSIDVDFNGDGPSDLMDESSRPGPFEYTYSRPGVYDAYFRILSEDGVTRTYVVPITVHANATLEARSRVPWNNFTTALRANSSQAALLQMTAECAQRYQPLLEALQDSLTDIADSTSVPELVGFYGDIAEYAVTRTVQGQQSAYLIYMMRGADGIWRIASL